MTRILACTMALLASLPSWAREAERPPNILFIAVDDLRPELGCAGAEYIQSPRIDELAGRGVLFTRAYCQFPVCGPSRASLLSGLRPTRTRFVDNRANLVREAPDVSSLPDHLQSHGYITICNGKNRPF